MNLQTAIKNAINVALTTITDPYTMRHVTVYVEFEHYTFRHRGITINSREKLRGGELECVDRIADRPVWILADVPGIISVSATVEAYNRWKSY